MLVPTAVSNAPCEGRPWVHPVVGPKARGISVVFLLGPPTLDVGVLGGGGLLEGQKVNARREGVRWLVQERLTREGRERTAAIYVRP